MGQIITRSEKARRLYEYSKWRKFLQNEMNATDKSLAVALEVVEFLKENFREEGLFRYSGRCDTRQKILTCMIKGDKVSIKPLLQRSTIIECASALQTFIRYLKQPIIPVRVQQLVLADNPGIPENLVASDALGLLQQDLSGPHLELLLSLFELIYLICSNYHRNEFTCVSLPITLLPTFFNIKQPWGQKWRQVATRFHELIIKAPEWSRQKKHYLYNSDAPIGYHSYINLLRQRIVAH
ncbi:uncharacterized protein LOC106674043 [Cimex lectularius]|uniref:Rho-GAP domain-containing protein n=1 Tax=Cimex lectularius TaxID=79782 RepID=A0A8I6S9J8_CIMLE|nr:uncharacterized protein LOC106674043 [Cimex lectularius]